MMYIDYFIRPLLIYCGLIDVVLLEGVAFCSFCSRRRSAQLGFFVAVIHVDFKKNFFEVQGYGSGI